MNRNRLVITPLLVSLLAGAAGASAVGGAPSTPASIVAAAKKEGKLLVYSTTDASAAASLLDDFATLYAEIKVEYVDINSSELYERFVREADTGTDSSDLIWSSAMDLQIKLVNDGYALHYDSSEAELLPPWAIWKNEAYGTTFEPIGFAYNKRLLAPNEVPQSHAELVELLRTNIDRFKGKLASYDPEKSGIGFLLITQDARIDPAFHQAVSIYGAVGIQLYGTTSAMTRRIVTGEHLLGFNLIGSYAFAAQRDAPDLGIVYPRDYTLVVTRIALIPKVARHANAAKLFLDYLLSRRGQDVLANRGKLFSIRPDVEGETTAAALEKALGKSLKPIPVGPGLLVYLDQAKRLEFLKQWQRSLAADTVPQMREDPGAPAP